MLETDIDGNFQRQLPKALKEDPELKLRSDIVKFVHSNPGKGNEHSYLIELADLLVGLLSHMFAPSRKISTKKKRVRCELAWFFKSEILEKSSNVNISYFPEDGKFYEPPFSKEAFDCVDRILK